MNAACQVVKSTRCSASLRLQHLFQQLLLITLPIHDSAAGLLAVEVTTFCLWDKR
ncbi:Hypothetical predicted protein [Xyrichtys novacula]|uniref:Uncharacterized protein n=1 Tax=Xyrichtys novacula TaxID=13765 RepID=A0AAV1H101_XYRNO|nr:Hypothetical predicted protein [Xyrichtys novacula]